MSNPADAVAGARRLDPPDRHLSADVPRRGVEVRIALAALGFRCVSAFLALCVNLAFPLDHHLPDQSSGLGPAEPVLGRVRPPRLGLGTSTSRRNGYDATNAVAGGRSNIAFAPVYPLLMRYVGRAFGRAPGDVYLGGIVVSWVSFVPGDGRAVPPRPRSTSRDAAPSAPSLLTAIFPFSFFFGAVYTESTFLLFTLLAFLRVPDASGGRSAEWRAPWRARRA